LEAEWLNRPDREDSSSPPSSVEIKNTYSYRSTHPYAFTQYNKIVLLSLICKSDNNEFNTKQPERTTLKEDHELTENVSEHIRGATQKFPKF
jgi:hypothetical protein